MKVNRFVFILIILFILVSITHISAIDVNETDLNGNSIETDYEIPISYSDDTDFQNDNVICFENSDEILTDSENLNHVYVSPDGNGNGSDENNPGNFKEILTNVEDNSIIHMSDGKYSLTGSDTISIQSKNNITFIADNSGKVEISSELDAKKEKKFYYYYPAFTIEDSYNINFIDILFSSNMEFKTSFYSAKNGYFYSNNGNVKLSFENCTFLYKYDTSTKLPPFIMLSNGNPNLSINCCNFTTFGFRTIWSAGNVLINNTFFNKTTTEFSNEQHFFYIIGNFIINNSNFVSLHNYTNIGYLGSGSLIFENNNLDHIYAFIWALPSYQETGNGKFLSHTTLTFLDGEESVTVGENSNLVINASLVDDYGNIIILPNIKCTIFGQERTLSYSDGVYQTTVTTPDILDTYYIDGVDDFIDTYLSDCTIIKPDIVVKHSHNVTLNTSDIEYGENATLNITVSTVESGNISYTIKNSKNEVIKEVAKEEFSNNFTSIALLNLDADTYTISGTVLATGEYENTDFSKTFTVRPITPNISVVFSNVTTLDNIIVNVTAPEGVTGKISIRVNKYLDSAHSTYQGAIFSTSVDVKSGDSVFIQFGPLEAWDEYGLGWGFTSNNTNYNNIKNAWDVNYKTVPTFSVVKADSNLTIKADDIDWGNNVTVSITTDSKFTGNITVKLGDDEKIAEIKDGSGNVSFANLKADTYNVTAKFNETDLFIASQKDINVTVNKVNSTLTLGEDIVFDWNKTGSTTVSYSGATNVEAVIVETGTSIPIQGNTITVSNLKAGNYTLRVTTVPDENHTGVTKEVNIKVNKVNSTLTLGDDIIFNYGESGSTTVSYEGATSVVAEVVDNTATIKIENGNITVSGLDASNYTLKVTTQVDENHTSISKTVNIKVNKVDSDINILNPVNYVYGNVGQCSVFSDGVINFTAVIVDHPEANITIDNGIVNVSGLKVGNYTLRVTANPDRNHNSVFRECNVTVNMAEVPADQALNITVPADSQSPTFSINLDSSAEGNFTVYVDGKEWGTVKVVNGSASITVANLPAGNHNITISYSGDDNHAAIVQNTTLSISKIATGISASKVTAVYLTSKKLVVTLKDKAGNILTGMKVTVKVGSISKTLTTDSKGQVSVDVSKLVPKTYTAKFTFAGDDKYLKSEGSASVKINKAASKITAKKKTFKAKKKTKKYTITLKSGKKLISKVKVTIKVGKKTYTAKTNKKGKATFNLKKLTKKGKYNAVIKFKGNKYYKASSKKVKITVK